MVPIYSIDDSDGVERALAAIRAGQIIAFPTDTLYGVGGNALSAAVMQRVRDAKRRDAVKAVPMLLSSVDEVARLAASWPAGAARLAARYWPGPLTIVVPALARVPDGAQSEGAVALRVPGLASLRDLIRRAGCPLIGTSANVSGEPAAVTASEAAAAVGGSVSLVLDGGRVGGAPSTIVSIEGGRLRVLREGAISASELLAGR
ncbi:MAG: L-threonylcarbamoyladenylate synthase [Chloroflexota bacterium]